MDRATPSTGRTSANVRAEVARAGLTQRAVAGLVGMSYSQWQRRTSGDVEWRVEELRSVARVLGVRLDVLTGDRGDGSNSPSTG